MGVVRALLLAEADAGTSPVEPGADASNEVDEATGCALHAATASPSASDPTTDFMGAGCWTVGLGARAS